MKSIEIQGEVRTDLGKTTSKLLRANGKIPCIVYGGEKNIHVIVEEGAFEKVYKTPEVYLVRIIVGKEVIQAIIKEIQFHPVTDKVLHVDFYQIFEDKPFSIKMPVNIIGDSEGVKQGGKLQIKMRKLRVSGLLKDIPAALDVDITKVQLGQSVKVPSLSYPNVEIQEPKNAVVCSVNLTRSAIRARQEAEKAQAEAAKGKKK